LRPLLEILPDRRDRHDGILGPRLVDELSEVQECLSLVGRATKMISRLQRRSAQGVLHPHREALVAQVVLEHARAAGDT